MTRVDETPREWWVIYGAVDKAMSRDLGTSPSMIASAVYDALFPKSKPVCCSNYEEYRAKHEVGA